MANERPRQQQEQEQQRREAEPFSVVTLLGAIGGALIVIAFFAPIFKVADAGAERNEAQVMIADYQRQFQRARAELDRLPPGFQAMVEPATAHVAAFLDTPSLKNLVFVAADARDLLEVSAAFDPEHAEQMREVRGIVGAFLVFVVAMPVIGAYPLIRGVLRGFRKQGAVGLAVSFLAGLIYFSIAALLLLGMPDASREQVGIALWLLGVGGLLLFGAGIFGVSKRTWWKAYLLDIAGLVALGLLLAEVVEHLNRR